MNRLPTVFDFKEVDPEGYATLKVISDAVNFNDWTFEVIRPFCKGRILEIGSGIGNISSRFLDKGYDLTLSDIRINYCSFLSEKFPDKAKNQQIIPIDLVHPNFEKEYESLLGQFDTVFALNVIEHIENDELAVSNCRKLLQSGGRLIVLMPAFQLLYNTFDKELCHFKRYNKMSVEKLFKKNQFGILKTFYFNAGGIPGWYVSGSIFKNKIIPASQMKTFDKLVPIFKVVDKILMNSVGLSVICAGEK